jgi:Amt family ammonium transporter
MEPINSGDTAWVLVSSALVLMMTPALAFFYGGMVRKKNILSTLTRPPSPTWPLPLSR